MIAVPLCHDAVTVAIARKCHRHEKCSVGVDDVGELWIERHVSDAAGKRRFARSFLISIKPTLGQTDASTNRSHRKTLRIYAESLRNDAVFE